MNDSISRRPPAFPKELLERPVPVAMQRGRYLMSQIDEAIGTLTQGRPDAALKTLKKAKHTDDPTYDPDDEVAE